VQVSADAKAIELLADIAGSGLTGRTVGFAQAFSVIEQLASYEFWIGERMYSSARSAQRLVRTCQTVTQARSL
jgi:hypothetical protein